VLALESVDLPDGVALEEVRLDSAVAPRAHGDGAVVRARAVSLPAGGAGTPPFGTGGAGGPATCGGAGPDDDGGPAAMDLPLVPYHRWAERGPSTMRVFIPTTRGRRTGSHPHAPAHPLAGTTHPTRKATQ
jgi:hypothetical protein